MSLRIFLTLLAGLVTIAGMVAAAFDRPGLRWLRPLATFFVLLLALASSTPQTIAYKFAITAGLACLLLADLLSMLPDGSYFPWYISTMLGLLALLVGFTGDIRGVMPLWASIPVLGASLFGYARLANRFGRRRLWQLALIIVVSFVVWTGFGRALRFPELRTLFASAGAALLYAASWLTALQRFHPHPSSDERLVTLAYIPGLLALAWSV